MSAATDDRPVFVVGAPRSGTTLLRTLLDAHPGLAVAQETHWFLTWVPRHRDADLGDPAALEAFWRDFTPSPNFQRLLLDPEVAFDRLRADGVRDLRGLFRSLLVQYAEATGKPRWGEKTPAHYEHLDTLLRWFPAARVLFVVRDPRAVVNSHVTLPGRRFPTDVEAVTRSWVDAVATLERWGGDPRVHRVRYESLVRDPADELGRACDHVGLPFAEEMLATKRPVRGLPAMPAGFRPQRERGSLSPRGPVSTTNLERWRAGLQPSEVAVIEHVAGPAMARCGYERSTDRMPLEGWSRLWLLRLLRSPRTALRPLRATR